MWQQQQKEFKDPITTTVKWGNKESRFDPMKHRSAEADIVESTLPLPLLLPPPQLSAVNKNEVPEPAQLFSLELIPPTLKLFLLLFSSSSFLTPLLRLLKCFSLCFRLKSPSFCSSSNPTSAIPLTVTSPVFSFSLILFIYVNPVRFRLAIWTRDEEVRVLIDRERDIYMTKLPSNNMIWSGYFKKGNFHIRTHKTYYLALSTGDNIWINLILFYI